MVYTKVLLRDYTCRVAVLARRLVEEIVVLLRGRRGKAGSWLYGCSSHLAEVLGPCLGNGVWGHVLVVFRPTCILLRTRPRVLLLSAPAAEVYSSEKFLLSHLVDQALLGYPLYDCALPVGLQGVGQVRDLFKGTL